MRYYTMEHRGGLKESLDTKKEITFEKFCDLLPLYDFYCYDDRISCNRYILKDFKDNLKGYTTWLLKEIKPKTKYHNLFKEVF